MIDVKPMVVAALQEVGLPVYYEMFINTSTPTPCITYLELSNSDTLGGDTLEYSSISMQIKVWATEVSLITEKGIIIDGVMKELGFKREFSTEMSHGGMIQKVLRYRATGFKK